MPILIDEFDQYQHRQRVLELFRTSSKGGKVLRGTADQAGLQFGLHHIPWLAAIESGDVFVQDSNRFIHLELLPPEGRNLVLPTERELHELGVEMAAAAIWASLSAVSLAEVIKGTSIGGVPGRLVESFSVPAAMFAVLRHGREATEAQATNILRGMIDGRQTVEVQREPEHEQLLHEILATNIRVQLDAGLNMVNKELSIGQLMEQHSRYTTELESKGLRVVTPHGSKERMLFIAHDTVLRQLLSGTRWQYLRIDQILARFPGAQRSQQRLHGGRCRGVAIRLSQCLASGDIEEQDRGEERDSQDSGVTA